MKTIQDVRNDFARAIADLVPRGYSPEVALLDGSGRKKRKDAAARNWDPLSGSISITFVKPEDQEQAGKIREQEEIIPHQKIDKSVEVMMNATGMSEAEAAQTVADLQKKAKERNEKRMQSAATAVQSEVVTALPAQFVEAIRALDSAEHKVSFVALKWFRDQFLPGLGSTWAASSGAGQDVIREAIERGIFLTNKVHNPKSPAFPTTAIRLNRQSAEVQKTLGSSSTAQSRFFRPVEIRGAGLSNTILQERG